MDEIITKLNEKLKPSVQRLRNGNHDEHDILPALLWILLAYDQALHKILEVLPGSLTEAQTAAAQKVEQSLKHETTQIRKQVETSASSLTVIHKTTAQKTEQKLKWLNLLVIVQLILILALGVYIYIK